MIVVGVIIYATWYSHPLPEEEIPAIPHIDKLIHAIMMGGLTGAVLFDYRRADRTRRIGRKTVVIVSLSVALFAVVDEIVQGLLPIGRPSDYVDLLSDWVGVLVASLTAPSAVRGVLKSREKVS